jgi:NADH-quinone oxidoreductase subunit G
MLYAKELEEPNSPAAHALLHTSYAARNSRRLVLMQFLDAVDRRDAEGVGRLFHPDGQWSTASPLGDVRGRVAIETLVRTDLPPRRYGPAHARHRMASPAELDDLTVLAPTGEHCRFSMETCTVLQDGRLKTVIRKLQRHVLS